MAPIFVSSSFRTSSTWIWEKFRQSKNTLTYYEPFHEALSYLRKEDALSIGPEAWKSGHPSSAPYFLEFVPMLKAGGGVHGFSENFAFKEFFPPTGSHGDLSSEQHSYVSSLVAHAERKSLIPVLACTRSLGRMGALKKAFGGVHVFLYRPIFDQWASYLAQSRSGNDYFINTTMEIIVNNQHDRFMRWIFNRYISSGDQEINRSYEDNCFYCHFSLHVYLYLLAIEECDIELNSADISIDKLLSENFSRDVFDKSGVVIDVSDAKRHIECGPFTFYTKELDCICDVIVNMIDASWRQKKMIESLLSNFIRDYSVFRAFFGYENINTNAKNNYINEMENRIRLMNIKLKNNKIDMRIKDHVIRSERMRSKLYMDNLDCHVDMMGSIHSSFSWRVTGPLRYVSRFARSLIVKK